jgi:hypothetical protein
MKDRINKMLTNLFLASSDTKFVHVPDAFKPNFLSHQHSLIIVNEQITIVDVK